MIYTPQQMDAIFNTEKATRQNLCALLTHWEVKSKDLEYSKKQELKKYITVIDAHLDASVDLVNMLYTLCLQERDSYARIREQNDKLKRFIRNQGFNPEDLNWVNIEEI